MLLPAVREADADTLIIADGFSCREQIAGLTGRGALHLAQVLQMALHEGPEGPSEVPPERRYEPLGKWMPGSPDGINGAANGNGRTSHPAAGLIGEPERTERLHGGGH